LGAGGEREGYTGQQQQRMAQTCTHGRLLSRVALDGFQSTGRPP
jgi:hypothetical protein